MFQTLLVEMRDHCLVIIILIVVVWMARGAYEDEDKE